MQAVAMLCMAQYKVLLSSQTLIRDIYSKCIRAKLLGKMIVITVEEREIKYAYKKNNRSISIV